LLEPVKTNENSCSVFCRLAGKVKWEMHQLMLIEPPADHSMQFSLQLSGKVVTEISQPLSLPPSSGCKTLKNMYRTG
jgi:hypothetical protein